MGPHTPNPPLPDKDSSSLHLTHPTIRERTRTWTLNCKNWGSALGLTSYLEREEYLTTVPLAADGGVTHWILVDSSLPPDNRPILATCESLRKRALVSQDGKIREVITHGIGSVFSDPEYRGRGYGGRMLKELGPTLKDWQTDNGGKECPFSILYSDIGKKFYTRYGWQPFPSTHMAFPPSSVASPETAKRLEDPDIESLCELDVEYVRRALENVKDAKIHFALVPDHDQMQWHHMREDFMTNKLFGHSPSTRGAITGVQGSRVWAIWTRSFSAPIDKPESGNILYILRLVIEDDSKLEANARALRSVVEIAQKEAEEWKLDHVELWNPTEVVQRLVEQTGLEHDRMEREESSIASLMWYGEGSGKVDEIEWVANEKYGWC